MSYAMNSRRSGGWSSSSNQPPPVIEPRRFGLKYEPPSIVLEYTRQGRLRLYEVHLKPSDLEKVMDEWLELEGQSHMLIRTDEMPRLACCVLGLPWYDVQDAETIAQRLVKKHGAYFDPAKVDMSQVSHPLSSRALCPTKVLDGVAAPCYPSVASSWSRSSAR